MPFSEWNKLIYGIARGECTLFLGRELPVLLPNGERHIPEQALSRALLDKLDLQDENQPTPPAEDLANATRRFLLQEEKIDLQVEPQATSPAEDLANAARRFVSQEDGLDLQDETAEDLANAARRFVSQEDGLDLQDETAEDLANVARRFLSQEDELGLEIEIQQWHEKLADVRSPLHDDLAALPFRRIVTSAFDPLVEAALERVSKTPAVKFYNYRGDTEDLLPEPSEDEPLLYHLFGHPSDTSSLVLTDVQLLDFLAALIAKNPPLPNDLNDTLSNGRLFLFLGFGLRHWYLRVILHVLKVLNRQGRGFAVEALDGTGGAALDDAILFYSDFKFDIYRQDVAKFVGELRKRYEETPAEKRPVPIERVPRPGSTLRPEPPLVFVCHASEDKPWAQKVYKQLRAKGLRPWLDEESLRGGTKWEERIPEVIRQVDYFVVLNSRNLETKSRKTHYVNKEIKEAKKVEEDYRLAGAFIIPAVVDQAPLLPALSAYHAVDLTKSNGTRDLVRAIKAKERWG